MPQPKYWDEGWLPEDYERWDEFIKNLPPPKPVDPNYKMIPTREITVEQLREIIEKSNARKANEAK